MRVLFFLALPNPFPGAGWTRVGHFAQSARKRGHDVKVVGSFLSYRFNRPSVVDWKGVRIYNICPVFGLDSMFSYVLDFVSSMIMSLFILVWWPNVVVISTPPCGPSIGTWLCAKLIRSRIIIDYRDFFVTYRLSTSKSRFDTFALKIYRSFMSSLYRMSEVVVTVTSGTRDILTRLGVSHSVVIPNGADVEIFKPLNLKNPIFTVVFVCGTVSYYDLIPTLRAVSLLNDLSINIVVVGEFSSIPRKAWIANVMRVAQELGLIDSLIFTGPITDPDELAEIISASDVGLVPIEAGHMCSKTAYPVKLFEYGACGIPSIVTIQDDSLVGRLVHEHQIGIVVPFGDVVELSNAIRKLYESYSYRMMLGKNGREMVVSHFDRVKNGEKMMRLIEMVAAV